MNIPFNEKRFEIFLNIAQVITKIILILLLVALASITVGAVVVLFIPQSLLTIDFAQIDTLRVEILNTQLRLPNTLFQEEVMIRTTILLSMLAAIAHLIFIGLILHTLSLMFDDVRAQKPFSENNVQRMYRMAMIFITGAIVLPLFLLFAGLRVVHDFNLDATVTYSSYTNLFLVGLLLLILASIFQYGNYLQNEVDQTV